MLLGGCKERGESFLRAITDAFANEGAEKRLERDCEAARSGLPRVCLCYRVSLPAFLTRSSRAGRFLGRTGHGSWQGRAGPGTALGKGGKKLRKKKQGGEERNQERILHAECQNGLRGLREGARCRPREEQGPVGHFQGPFSSKQFSGPSTGQEQEVEIPQLPTLGNGPRFTNIF